jgi:DNA-binding NtrC family response regulator
MNYLKPDTVVTILFVNPRTDDRNSLRHILEHSNWKLHEVTSCKEAMGLLKQHHIPVVVCERELPDGDWRQLLDQVMELPSPPHLVVSSRHADDRLWAEVLNLGGYDVLAVPFDSSEVFRVAFLAWQSWKNTRGIAAPKPLQHATSGSPGNRAIAAGE